MRVYQQPRRRLNFCFIFGLVLCPFLFALNVSIAAELSHEFLDDASVATLVVDLDKLDIPNLTASLSQGMGDKSLTPQQEEDFTSLVQRSVTQIKSANVTQVGFVFSMNNFRVNVPYIVLPSADEKSAVKLLELIQSDSAFQGMGLFESSFRKGSTVVCGARNLQQRLKNSVMARKEGSFAKALASQSATAMKLIIAPTSDQYRVLAEMTSEESPQRRVFRNHELSNIEWISVEIPPTGQTLNGVCSVSDSSQADRVAKLLPELIDSIEQDWLKAENMKITPSSKSQSGLIHFSASMENKDASFTNLASKIIAFSAMNVNVVRNLKFIGIAMHNFHDRYGSFPPSASYSKDGKPLLSWRVYVLPYLDEEKLYKEFHLDEAWDSEHNIKLVSKMPEIFASKYLDLRLSGKTTIVVPVDNQSVFHGKEGVAIKEIIDGTSNTIMTLNAPRENAVVWTKPGDCTIDWDNVHDQLFSSRDGFWAAFCDGSARKIPKTIPLKTLKAILTRNKKELVEAF